MNHHCKILSILSFTGIIKKAIRHRPELKIVITSATLDIKKFAEYFDAPMVKIPGKVFPVTVRHLPSHGRMGHATYRGFSHAPQRALWSRTNNPEAYINMAIEKVLQIHTENLARTGDILLFLPGKEEVSGSNLKGLFTIALCAHNVAHNVAQTMASVLF